MSEALGTTLISIFVFIVVPWGLILTLRLVGRRASRRPTDRCAAG